MSVARITPARALSRDPPSEPERALSARPLKKLVELIHDIRTGQIPQEPVVVVADMYDEYGL